LYAQASTASFIALMPVPNRLFLRARRVRIITYEGFTWDYAPIL
jgi:hypothetical protein